MLQTLTLRDVAHEVVPTKTEKYDKWEHNRDIGEMPREVEDILSGLNDPKSWTDIQAHFMGTYNRHLKELLGKGVDKEGFQEVKGGSLGLWIVGLEEYRRKSLLIVWFLAT